MENIQEDRKPYYYQRIKEVTTNLSRLRRKSTLLGWLRLGVVVGIFLTLYYLWPAPFWILISIEIVLIPAFLFLVHNDLDNKEKIAQLKRLIRVNEDELKGLDHEPVFENGAQFTDKEHEYASDLDIFGQASIFGFLNRTTSEPGAALLASWLQVGAYEELIPRRQEAEKELAGNMLWVQEFRAFGLQNMLSHASVNTLKHWVHRSPVFLNYKPWRWLRVVLPVIIITICVLYFFGIVSEPIFYAALLIFGILSWQIYKKTAPIHQQLSKISNEMNTLASQVQLVEAQTFHSSLLRRVQQDFTHDPPASKGISKLRKLTNNLDLQYNLLLAIPLNLLLFWHLQQTLELEKWKVRNHSKIKLWIDTLSEVEALCSLATLHFNYPEWTFPEVKGKYFHLQGTNIGHPLIPEQKRINNPVQITEKGEIMLVTGSNMAGKSTYLRSIGVNIVLALAGGPVCASSFSFSPVKLISSMRVTDNLEESTSTFYAELKKLKTIIDHVNRGEEVFILLDEILRGTNSHDRHIGSRALIRQLIEKDAAGMLATHDLELAKMEEDFPGSLVNYHFDVQVSGEELYFDYLLKPGICTSLNASVLMKKIGIDL